MAFTLHNVIDRRSSKVKILLANWEFNDNRLATILGVTYNEVAKMRKSAERRGSVTVEMKMSRLDAQIGKCKVIIDNKIESVRVRFARCCLPCYGDNVVAHSDTERGMVIHHKKCKQVTPFLKKDPRYMSAIWGENKKDYLYKVRIDINTEDKVGVLSDVSSVFARSGINIGYVNTKTIDKKFAGFEIQIEVKDKQELRQIMQKIRAMKITTSCKRNINEK